MKEPALYITWYDRPDENERLYNHYGCEGYGVHWTQPLDDTPEPQDGDTYSCPHCGRRLPLKHDALHEEPQTT